MGNAKKQGEFFFRVRGARSTEKKNAKKANSAKNKIFNQNCAPKNLQQTHMHP